MGVVSAWQLKYKAGRWVTKRQQSPQGKEVKNPQTKKGDVVVDALKERSRGNTPSMV